MSDFLLKVITNPLLGQNLFCKFYNDGEVPLPPPESSYFITENESDYFLTEDGLNRFITE